MLSIPGFLLFIVVVVIPAYFMNKWMIRVTRPRESFARLFTYIILSVAVAIVYAALFILVITTIYPLPNK